MKRKKKSPMRYEYGTNELPTLDLLPTLNPRLATVTSQTAKPNPLEGVKVNTNTTPAPQQQAAPIVQFQMPNFSSLAGSPYTINSSMGQGQYSNLRNKYTQAIMDESSMATSAISAAGSAFGPIGAGVAGIFNTALGAMARNKAQRLQNTKTGWSPGQEQEADNWFRNFNTGGDIQLSNNSFQVQGNANQTDGNYYPQYNAKLDHNEVVSNVNAGPFVFSDSIKATSGKTFALEAKKYEKAKGKAEEMLSRNPYDVHARNAVNLLEGNLKDLASQQEQKAAAMGHRNPDGSTKQPGHYAKGGRLDANGDPIKVGTTSNGVDVFYDPDQGKYGFVMSDGYFEVLPDNTQAEYTKRFPVTADVIRQSAASQSGVTGGRKPGPGYIQMEDNNWYNPNTRSVLTELDGEYVDLVEGADFLAPQYDASLKASGQMPTNPLGGSTPVQTTTTGNAPVQPTSRGNFTTANNQQAVTPSFAPPVAPGVRPNQVSMNVPDTPSMFLGDGPVQRPLNHPPMVTPEQYWNNQVANPFGPSYTNTNVSTAPQPAPTPGPAPSTTNVSTAKGSGQGTGKSTGKGKGKGKYSYDPVTQGPLTINNNALGMSVPTGPHSYVDMKYKDAFGQVNPSATAETIPFSGAPIEKKLDTLPGRLNGQNWRSVGLLGPNQSYMMQVGPDGKPYTPTNMPPAPKELEALKKLSSPEAMAARNAGPTSMGADPNDYNYQTPFTVGDALQAVEVASKFAALSGGPEVEKPYMDTTRVSKASYDVDPQLYQSQRNLQNYMASVDTNNINLRRGLFNQGYAQKLNTDSQIRDRYQQMRNQAQIDYESRLSNQKRFNIGQQVYTNDINARNRGAYANLRDNAFTSLGNFGEQLNRKVYANDAIGMYREVYPEVFGQAARTLDRQDLLKLFNLSTYNNGRK